ncbi:CRAL/TRIO domain-containing protein, partial [Gonapodya prolifera JEL478]
CDTPCLLRYLRARNFDVTKAAAMLSATLKWRFGTYKPHTVTKEEVEQESGGNNYVSGFDKHARPIMYLKKRGVVKDPVLNVRLLMSMVEFAVTVMAPGVGQMVIIMDMKEYTWANRPPASVTMDTLNFLSNHYPERLGKCFIVDAPWVFSTLWNLVRPFLDPVTAAKISFI